MTKIKQQELRILIASADEHIVNSIKEYFLSDDPTLYTIDVVVDGTACLQRFLAARYDYVFIENALLGISEKDFKKSDYLSVLRPYKQAFPTVPIFIITNQERSRSTVRLVQAGAAGYLTYPFDPLQVKLIIEKTTHTLQQGLELDYLRDQFWKLEAEEYIRTNSSKMQDVFNKIKSSAPTSATILLQGETGTGKGLLAKLIHQHSSRSEKPFVSIHCGAIPENLVESELFGHEKGAFTGATTRKLGKFEVANGGTIFLDEIATMPYNSQIKLLQILQDKTFQRVGGTQAIETDVRVIAATNVNLKNCCDENKFRVDLYYRLHVFPIEVPALRERVEDIELLLQVFLARLNQRYFKNMTSIEPQVIDCLSRYHWPGNVRELENLIERAYILETTQILRQESFPLELMTFQASCDALKSDEPLNLSQVRRIGVENIESRYLKDLLAANHGKIGVSAEVAGITTRQLHKLLTKYSIKKEDFKVLKGNL